MSLEAAYILPHPPLAVPAVGKGEQKKIPTTIAGYEEVARRIAHHRPATIVFISPHTAYYADWIFIAAGERATGNFAQFGVSPTQAPNTQLGLTYNRGFREGIIECAKGKHLKAGYVELQARPLDHGVLVPLYFIQEKLPSSEYQAVSIGGSGLPNEDLILFGNCIAQIAHESSEKVIVVVSGDLSHRLAKDGPYGYNPAGPVFDEEFGRIVRSGDPMGFARIDSEISENAAECGLSGFVMLAGLLLQTEALERKRFSSELLSLEGPFGVGYGVAAFEKE